jgi:outer membrane protein assembly factor BamB
MRSRSVLKSLEVKRASGVRRILRGLVMATVFGLGFASGVGSVLPAVAQVNSRVVAPLGLEVAWENNIGGAGLAQGPQSFVIWPHSKERREYVDVFVGSRLLERIDARQVDRAALDKLILEGKSTSPVPVLGMEGAKARADKLIQTYGVLGKKATMRTFSEPVIYIVSVAKNGVVTAIDGESGELLWQNSVPRADLPILGPGVSDDYVAVINGNSFYGMDLKTGNLINNARLAFTPVAAPTALETRVVVPSTEGRVVGYSIENPNIAPVVLRAGVENRHGVTGSLDHEFLAWNSQGSMFIVHNENVPKMWSKVNLGEPIDSKPVATPQGFLFVSSYGTAIHATAARTGTYLWRANLGMPVSQPPVVSNTHAFVLSDDGRLVALDLKTGAHAWVSHVGHVDSVLGVGKEHIYVKNDHGYLSRLRLADGKVDGVSGLSVDMTLPNNVSDRLFVITRDGHLSCLREEGALMPTMINAIDSKGAAKSTGGKPAVGSGQSKPVVGDDIFGSPSGVGSGASSTGGANDDPFGGP